jgi:hypothetical protein
MSGHRADTADTGRRRQTGGISTLSPRVERGTFSLGRSAGTEQRRDVSTASGHGIRTLRRCGVWLALCALAGCYQAHGAPEAPDAAQPEPVWCATRHDLPEDPCFATEAECREQLTLGGACYDARWYEP